MIAKVSLLCALVALVHGGAPLVGLGATSLGYANPLGLAGVRTIAAPGIGLASPLGLRSIGGLGLASPLGLGSIGGLGLASPLGLRSIGGLGLAASGIGLAGIRTIAAPGIGLASPLGLRSIGGLGLASPLGLGSIGGLGLASPLGLRSIGGLGLAGVRTIAAPGIGLASPLGLRGIGGLGLAASPLGLATAGIKVAAPITTVGKAVIAAAQPYSFGYGRQTDDGSTVSRQESSDAGNNRQGSYSIQNADGTYRVVSYVADAAGFRAVVKTNEPGTAPQNPAATQILAEEPPYKVLPAAAPIIKTAAIGVAASPLIKTAGLAGIGGLGAIYG